MDAEEIKAVLAEDPGNSIFPEYADELRRRGELSQALEICLAGLSASPSSYRGRLVLAHVFYEKGLVPFAIREIEHLCLSFPEKASLRKLLKTLSPEAAGRLTARPEAAEKKVFEGEALAEAEFDEEQLRAVDEEEAEEQH